MGRLFVLCLAAGLFHFSALAQAVSSTPVSSRHTVLSGFSSPLFDGPLLSEEAIGCSELQGGSTPCHPYGGGIAWKGVVDSTGMRYVSVGMSSLSQAEKDLVHLAMHEWNIKSPTTKLTFVDDDGWWGTDINVEVSSSVTDNACGEYDPNSDTITLHQTLMDYRTQYPAQVKSTAGHELSHFLGLAHGATGGSNITGVFPTECTPEALAARHERTVTDDDAASARPCIVQKTDPNHQFPQDEHEQTSEYAYEDPPYTCYEVWYHYTYWRQDANGYWYIAHQWSEYQGILCVQ